MAKRKFRIEGGHRGGELTIGTVTKEFVEFFLNNDQTENDLITHLQSYEFEDPSMRIEGAPHPTANKDYQPAWNDIDDIEHLNNAWIDGGFTVTEVKYSSDDDSFEESIGETVVFEPHQLYSREAYHRSEMYEVTDHLSQADIDEHVKPVLVYHSDEKGGFAAYYVETDGEDFDPVKFCYSATETNIGDMLECGYYDRVQIEPDYSCNETDNKGFYVSVGYLNLKWHDFRELYVEGGPRMVESWDNYDEMLEYEEDQRKIENATTVQLNISANEIVGEVGTIDNPGEVDSNIEPISEPPVVNDEEAEPYKDFNQSTGEDGEEIV